jgi:glycosyltransferase involved in cell wall biosynthesis
MASRDARLTPRERENGSVSREARHSRTGFAQRSNGTSRSEVELPVTRERPLVSIVTPTLNQGAFIAQTIRSIQAQTYGNHEHIVVDGGSTDDTIDTLRRYEGRYALRWTSEPDGGMYDAVNKGLRGARGEILAYLNSDDLYLPWTLEVVVEAFRKRPDADLVFGDLLHIDETSGIQRLVWQMPFDLDFVKRVGSLGQPAVFWRRDVYRELGGFDDSLRYVADCDFWIRAGSTHHIAKVNEVLAIDREQAGSLRQAAAAGLDEELASVRSRYVDLAGPSHVRRMRRHRLRTALYRRAYEAAFAVQASLPQRLRLHAWRHFLAVPGVSVSLPWLLVSQIPRIGWRYVHRVVNVPNSISQ